MSSYLSEEEIDALQKSPLHRKAPFAITGVSNGFFSVSRYSGGCHYEGCSYVYHPLTDELIRGDVLKWVGERRKAAAKKQVREMESKQQELGI